MVYTFKAGINKHMYGDEIYFVDTIYETLIWEEVAPKKGVEFEHRIWRYNKETAQCPQCKVSTNMVYLIEPRGVIGRCVSCNISLPINPMEFDATGYGVEAATAELLKKEIVTTAEALKICDRIGQILPTIESTTAAMNKTKKKIPKTHEEMGKMNIGK
jgi:hypothetical protein